MSTTANVKDFHKSIKSMFGESNGSATSTTSAGAQTETMVENSKEMLVQTFKTNKLLEKIVKQNENILKGQDGSFLSKVLSSFLGTLGGTVTGITTGGLIGGIKGKITNTINAVKVGSVNLMKSAGKVVLGTFTSAVKIGLNTIKSYGMNLLKTISPVISMFKTASGATINLMQKVAPFVKIFPKFLAKLAWPITALMGLYDSFKGWKDAESLLGKGNLTVADKISSALGAGINGLTFGAADWISKQFGYNNTSSLFAAGKDGAYGIISSIGAGIYGMFGRLKDRVVSSFTYAWDMLPTLDTMKTWVPNLGESLYSGMIQIKDLLYDTVTGVISSAKDYVLGKVKGLFDWSSDPRSAINTPASVANDYSNFKPRGSYAVKSSIAVIPASYQAGASISQINAAGQSNQSIESIKSQAASTASSIYNSSPNYMKPYMEQTANIVTYAALKMVETTADAQSNLTPSVSVLRSAEKSENDGGSWFDKVKSALGFGGDSSGYSGGGGGGGRSGGGGLSYPDSSSSSGSTPAPMSKNDAILNSGSTGLSAPIVNGTINKSSGSVSDSAYDPMLNLLGKSEGTDKSRGYNETLGFGAYTNGNVDLTNMTLAEVDKLQTEMLAHPNNTMNSSAVGRAQIVRTTMRGLVKKMGLDPNTTKLDKTTQDAMTVELLNQRGFKDYLAGNITREQLADKLAPEWASLPEADGTGYYENQNSSVSRDEVYNAIDQTAANIRASEQKSKQATVESVGGKPVSDSVVENQGEKAGIRKLPIQDNLKSDMERSVLQALGPGHTIEVYSGGQAKKGTGGPRTGSTRHDEGRAGDVLIKGPDGKLVSQEKLALVAQEHTASKRGGVGMQMSGGGIHMDNHADRALSWGYENQGGPRLSKLTRERMALGVKGIRPELAMSDDEYKAYKEKTVTNMTTMSKIKDLPFTGNAFQDLALKSGIDRQNHRSSLEEAERTGKNLTKKPLSSYFENSRQPSNAPLSYLPIPHARPAASTPSTNPMATVSMNKPVNVDNTVAKPPTNPEVKKSASAQATKSTTPPVSSRDIASINPDLQMLTINGSALT